MLRRTSLALAAITALAVSSLALTSCGLATEKVKDKEDEAKAGSTVVLVTHDSFNLPRKLVRKFEKDSGLDLEIRQSGDAGELTSKLVLNQGNPLGDVAFGVDNTFASEALDNDVFAETDVDLPESAEDLRVEGDEDRLTPVDQASVCVNIDKTWFADQDLTPPSTLDDLIDPAYEDLFVVPGALTSSPGLAFLLTTVAAYGEDGWQDYWADLLDNGAKLTKGWEDAYFVDFTAGSKSGTRPIVLSYDTSPAFTVVKKSSETTTAALLDTCFRQVEYAGVLENAKNPAGGRELIQFLLSDEVQSVIPDNMYVFPVDDSVELPADWAKFAEQPTSPYEVSPADIAEHRKDWQKEWRDISSR
jgi:thiamine transport system substrate-binding protein